MLAASPGPSTRAGAGSDAGPGRRICATVRPSVANTYQYKDFAGSSHRILLSLIGTHARRHGTLVDLGAAGGELGEALRGDFQRTIGFELDIDNIARLKERFSRVVIADLERLTKLPREIDVLVLADVLEHLREPRDLLRIVDQSLSAEGRIFISVPNIANLTIRLGLLAGIFTYRDRGILDHTHLRFYTKKTLRREIERAGFEIVEMRGSAIPVRLIVGKWVPEVVLRPVEAVLAASTQIWKALFAYQFVLAARPRGR